MARKSLRPHRKPRPWERLAMRLLIVLAALVVSSVSLELWLGGPTPVEFLITLALVGGLVVTLWRSGILTGQSPSGLVGRGAGRDAGGARPLGELSVSVELALKGSGLARRDVERRLSEVFAERLASAKGLTRWKLREIRYDQQALAGLVRDPELVELLRLVGELEDLPPPQGDREILGKRWLRLLTKVEGYF